MTLCEGLHEHLVCLGKVAGDAPVGLRDEVEDETADLSLNVGRLVSDRDLSAMRSKPISSCSTVRDESRDGPLSDPAGRRASS